MDIHSFLPDTEKAAALAAAALFLGALGYAAVRDLRTLTIPNALVVTLLVGWGLLAPAAGLAPRDMALNTGAAAMVFFATVAAYAMGWMGAGDSKLLTVSALWLGAGAVLPFLMATMLAGGGLALLVTVLRLLPNPLPHPLLWPNRAAGAAEAVRSDLPYALAIAIGAVAVLPRTQWLGLL